MDIAGCGMTDRERIEYLEERLKSLREQLQKLKSGADKSFADSPEYKRMQLEIAGLKRTSRLAESRIQSELMTDLTLQEEVQKLRDDNIALCAEHGTEYWEGMSDARCFNDNVVAPLEKKILELKAECKAKDVVIAHLKDLLEGRDPLAPKKAVMGRPPIPEEQKERIREYRRSGWTIKAISMTEGVSLGAVSNICKNIKNNPSAKGE